MELRKLTEKDVEIKFTVEQEWIPVRGNAIVSGNSDYDRKIENEIMDRLDKGDIWAWAVVRVTVSWNGFKGSNSLRACSYHDESEFIADGYYSDMINEAIADLNRNITDTFKKLESLVVP